MQSKPYLLFDAGGTLVFPDYEFLIKTARGYGIELTGKQLFDGYYQLIYVLDRRAYRRDFILRDPWPQRFVYALSRTLGIGKADAHKISRDAQSRHQERNLWTFTFPWVRETLAHLAREGYRMSVLSNSDGRTKKVFQELGLDHCFDCIFDSQELGSKKPDLAIYKGALKNLDAPGMHPANVLFIGDFYEVDVRGANRAGIGAIHLDPLGLYGSFPGVHLADIKYLSQWLAQYTTNPQAFDLFPYGKSRCAAPSLEAHPAYAATPDHISTQYQLSELYDSHLTKQARPV